MATRKEQDEHRRAIKGIQLAEEMLDQVAGGLSLGGVFNHGWDKSTDAAGHTIKAGTEPTKDFFKGSIGGSLQAVFGGLSDSASDLFEHGDPKGAAKALNGIGDNTKRAFNQNIEKARRDQNHQMKDANLDGKSAGKGFTDKADQIHSNIRGVSRAIRGKDD